MAALSNEEKDKLKEILTTANTGAMEWMYKPAMPSFDDYLLGKKIDKFIDPGISENQLDQRGAIFNERVKANIEMDVSAKRREDPLFAIRLKEEDAKKRLLQNPVKMKQLQSLIQQRELDKSKKKKHKKNKKKHSKHDSDDEIMEKYLAVLKAKHGGHMSNEKISGQSSSDISDKESDNKRSKDSRKTNKMKTKHKSMTLRKSPSSMSDDGDGLMKGKDSYRKKEHGSIYQSSHVNKRSSEQRAYREGHRITYEDEEMDERYSRHKKDDGKYGLVYPSSGSHDQRSSSRHNEDYRDKRKHQRSISPETTSHGKSSVKSPKRSLTKKEKEAKLQEMMDDAKWRESMRSTNVKRYDEEDKKEKIAENDTRFLSSMMADHASRSSVEDRIKRNVYNVQRKQLNSDKAFTKR